jgi:hypothetical protein
VGKRGRVMDGEKKGELRVMGGKRGMDKGGKKGEKGEGYGWEKGGLRV